MRSMTGYGSGKMEAGGRSFLVEIRSVNHKYHDTSVKLPRTMLAFEDPVRKMVAAKISRGKVDVYISYESLSPDDCQVAFNEALGDNLFAELNKIKQRYNFKDEISLSMMYRFQGVIAACKNDEDDYKVGSPLWLLLEQAALLAIDDFLKMREAEGVSLYNDMLQKIDSINENVAEIEALAPTVALDFRKRLTEKMKELLGEYIDEARILAEVAVFADKSAIDEEITRLKSHTKQFKDILEDALPIGKKLDFLVQEMLREANTIGSKCNNIDITNNVILLKTSIEKIREQVQNVE